MTSGSAAIRTAGVLALTALIGLNLGACSTVKKLRGSEPVQRIKGENQSLDYPDDPGRAAYTMDRLGHREKVPIGAVAKSETSAESEVERNTPVAAISPQPAQPPYLGRSSTERPKSTPTVAAPPAPYKRPDVMSNAPPAKAPAEDAPKGPVGATALETKVQDAPEVKAAVKEAKAAPATPSPWIKEVAQPWKLGVLLASFKTRDAALVGWEGLINEHAELGPYFPFIQQVELGADKGGTFFRLVAAPVESRGEADRLCDKLEADGQFCRIAFASGEVEW